MTVPSETPLSVITIVHPAGSCRYPACKSSFFDSGVKLCVFNRPSDSGRVDDIGSRKERICEIVGAGGGNDEDAGEGKRVKVSDGGRIGGLRDCLSSVRINYDSINLVRRLHTPSR